MILTVDCKNLACPQPVIKTKEAYEKLKENDILNVELNSYSSIENVKRFAKNQGIYFKEQIKTKESTILSFVKSYEYTPELTNKDKSFFTLIITSIISAILASTCCLAPLLFLIFGMSMSSLSFLQIFAPYQIYFVSFAVIVILYLWYNYFKRAKNQLVCATPLCKNYKFYLCIGTVLVGILTTYPYWINVILE